jgi:hypothetical protein
VAAACEARQQVKDEQLKYRRISLGQSTPSGGQEKGLLRLKNKED